MRRAKYLSYQSFLKLQYLSYQSFLKLHYFGTFLGLVPGGVGEKKIYRFENPLIENVFWRFFWVVSVCIDTIMFVSIPVRNTETNRMFFGFAKQTEKQPKQIEFRFVSVRTGKKNLIVSRTPEKSAALPLL